MRSPHKFGISKWRWSPHPLPGQGGGPLVGLGTAVGEVFGMGPPQFWCTGGEIEDALAVDADYPGGRVPRE